MICNIIITGKSPPPMAAPAKSKSEKKCILKTK